MKSVCNSGWRIENKKKEVAKMKLQTFIQHAWTDHATNPEGVASQIQDNFNLITTNDQVTEFVRLLTHVFAEHLGQYENGLQLLSKIQDLSFLEADSESGMAVKRSMAVMTVAQGKHNQLKQFTTSDQIRVLTTVAAAFCGQGQVTKAKEHFDQALQLSENIFQENDPAIRALAVSGNNLAVTLEEKQFRSAEEDQLMILAALTGRKYWQLAGTWLHVERAEYRLAKTYLVSKHLDHALKHAKLCVQLVEENQADPIEHFFAFEILCLVEKARNNVIEANLALEHAKKYFELIQNEDDKDWCRASLEKIVKDSGSIITEY